MDYFEELYQILSGKGYEAMWFFLDSKIRSGEMTRSDAKKLAYYVYDAMLS